MIKPTKPVLDEERLKTMQVRASQVWRGERQPLLQCAADVLLLVQEVRELRSKFSQEKPDTQEVDDALHNLNKTVSTMASAFGGPTQASRWSKWKDFLGRKGW